MTVSISFPPRDGGGFCLENLDLRGAVPMRKSNDWGHKDTRALELLLREMYMIGLDACCSNAVLLCDVEALKDVGASHCGVEEGVVDHLGYLMEGHRGGSPLGETGTLDALL